MKAIAMKMVYFAVVLSLLIAVPCASAETINTATVQTPSSQWEASVLAIFKEMEMGDGLSFTVTEVPDYEPAFRFVHALDINDFMQLTYFDDGNDVFNSSVLTVNLDGVGASADQVGVALVAATIAGDPNATDALIVELIEVLCPDLEEVLSGEQRLTGAQTATMNGIGYMMELNEEARTARYFTNVVLTTDN